MNELVIYELHVGTFNEAENDNRPGQFDAVSARLGHLQKLGVNAIQIMPVAEFAGERSWGYNPSHIFAVETSYGGPLAFKRFVKRAHRLGIAVILDVVYNHLGPSDLDLWQFDGWSENNLGGIYFYNDDRAKTPWGNTRPDYGRGEVRQFILDNVRMWLEEYHVDGLRFDSTIERVIYSESHDEVANGQARVPQEVNPQDPRGWYARKRSTLAAAMVLTAPGIPMLFQGQEFLEGAWFRDTVPLDWDQRDKFHGIVRLYRDLVRLRLNRDGLTRGLCGQFTQVYHLDDERKVLAYHRWDRGGPADDVVVVANLLHKAQEGYVIGFPAAGTWKLRFNSDWQGYSEDFSNHPSGDVVAEPGEYDGFPFHAALSLGPYSVVIYSR